MSEVKDVRINEFINPFDQSLDQEYLFNIGSGVPEEKDLANKILDTTERGEYLYPTFLTNRILSTKEKIHDPIKRQEKALFQNTGKR